MYFSKKPMKKGTIFLSCYAISVKFGLLVCPNETVGPVKQNRSTAGSVRNTNIYCDVHYLNNCLL